MHEAKLQCSVTPKLYQRCSSHETLWSVLVYAHAVRRQTDPCVRVCVYTRVCVHARTCADGFVQNLFMRVHMEDFPGCRQIYYVFPARLL